MTQLGVHTEGGEDLKQVVVVEIEDDDGEDKRENGSEVVRWEKLLPRMVLRVLLVEADDSTRQIVAALLRKCNYKVAAISDGLEAWEILKHRHSNIDLILTELDLPSISGYALLTLIMEHDGCRNIPVIIMSSEDSISMVLKCMLKGAADFLIKPVRRNELKNLWRHVWRRLSIKVGHNPQSTGSGQLKAETTFENDPASNHSIDNVSSSFRNSRSSEKSSDAQDVLQMICGKGTGYSHKETVCHASDVQLEGTFALGASDTGQKETKFTSLMVQPFDVADASTAFKVRQYRSCTAIAIEDGKIGPQSRRETAYVPCHELVSSGEPVDLIGGITKHKCTTGQSSSNGELKGFLPTQELELSLRSSQEAEAEDVDEKHILNHSTASAFSWYSGNKRLRTFFPSTIGDLKEMQGTIDTSVLPNDLTSNEENKTKDFFIQSVHSEAMSPSPQLGPFPLQGVIFDGGVWTSYCPIFQPVYSQPTNPTAVSPNSALQREESPLLTSASLHSDPGTQGCCAPGEITNQCYELAEVHELKARESVDPSSSSIPCTDIVTQKSRTAYESVSEVTDVNAAAPSIVATGAMEESANDDRRNAFGHEQLRSRASHHSAEREAALAKFRLKRKGRCFEKKVRYQSRKRLAEQRPRVKGQFVRQTPVDPVIADAEKP